MDTQDNNEAAAALGRAVMRHSWVQDAELGWIPAQPIRGDDFRQAVIDGVTPQSVTAALKEGRAARLLDIPIEHNPYFCTADGDPNLHAAWITGWETAEVPPRPSHTDTDCRPARSLI